MVGRGDACEGGNASRSGMRRPISAGIGRKKRWRADHARGGGGADDQEHVNRVPENAGGNHVWLGNCSAD